MCTVITKQQWGFPLIAKEDIIVYKQGVMSIAEPTVFRCRFQNFKYLPDVVYTADIHPAGIKTRCVSDSIEDDYRNEINAKDRFYIEKGFHSFATFERAEPIFNFGIHIGKFIIPKGSEYYKNGCENVVSNYIIFKKFINEKEEYPRLD